MKSIGALQWLAKLISRTEENSFRIGELEYIYMYGIYFGTYLVQKKHMNIQTGFT